jgi:hypothetical protein
MQMSNRVRTVEENLPATEDERQVRKGNSSTMTCEACKLGTVIKRSAKRTPGNGKLLLRAGTDFAGVILRGRDRFEPTEPAGKPSFLGRPTGRLIFVVAAITSAYFFPLPFGLPGLRLGDTEAPPLVSAASVIFSAWLGLGASSGMD